MIKPVLYQLADVVDLKAKDLGIPRVQADGAQLNNILNTVYLVAGLVAVIVLIVGGILYVISTGEPEKIKTAKNAIIYAVVGLAVIMLAFTITSIVAGGIS